MLESMNAPLYPGEAAIIVRDLDAVAAYYETVLGFERIAKAPDKISLGAGNVALLHLLHRPEARLAPPNAAGLFHIAYLVPSRAELGAWLRHAADRGARLEGASDHLVSDALYLSDPEGNGIEVYADTPRETWVWSPEGVEMATVKLDIAKLLADGSALGSAATKLPAGTRIGHVHLKVGDIAIAERFFAEVAGLDITRRRDGGTFYASGRYHHHLATNVWRSPGAGKRPDGMTGLAYFEMIARDPEVFATTKQRLLAAGGRTEGVGVAAADPWGTVMRLVPL